MADLWYYTIDGKAGEPVSAAALQELATRGVLKPTDLVWHDGLPQWIRAGSAPELFGDEAEPVVVPVADEDDPELPVRDRDADRRRYDDRPRRRRRRANVDDGEDRPRRRRAADDDDDFPRRIRRAGMSTGTKIALIGGGLGMLVVVGLVVVLIIVLNGPDAVHTVPFRVQDQLTLSDRMDRVQNGCRCKVYWVHLDAGTLYSIQMMSLEPPMMGNPLAFDPLLRLEDSSGRELARDDDSGGWPNAHILFRAPHSGAYQVIATSFGPTVGRFRLSIHSRI